MSGRIRDLCLGLMNADTEEEVIDLLRSYGYWENAGVWRDVGDDEWNYSTIGNQQSRPEAALVEKLINCVDTRLLNACLEAGIDPESDQAPATMREAVAQFFEEARLPISSNAGRVRNWADQKRTEQARSITLSATGNTPNVGSGNPSFSIADAGEGQVPRRFPETFLSLHHKNKQLIHFVQGKFNMGGTGALQFCGRRNLQLILSKRNPVLIPSDSPESDHYWGVTVVRREDPTGGRKTSVYTYLAPETADENPNRGSVLSFKASSLPLFPHERRAYAREAGWGTLIKLYEYEASGFRSNIIQSDPGLLRRLDLLLPEVALPIRLYECRSSYRGHKGSFETNLLGLSVRLDDDRAENLEDGFPSSGKLRIQGEQMDTTIYAFKKGKGPRYRMNEGAIFTVNGQTHGYMPADFFKRKSVGMSYLSDSLLVTVDCGGISGRAREDLFMASRDRLRDNDLKRHIETELEGMIRNHSGLRALRARRRAEEISERLKDSKPLEEVLQSLLKRSPTLASLFLAGANIQNPFKTVTVVQRPTRYKGKRFPTYFKFKNIDYGRDLVRDSHINLRTRIIFETDAVNEYFSREDNQGQFELLRTEAGDSQPVKDFSLNLQEGIASLNLQLPSDVKVGDELSYIAQVTDDARIEPFTNRFKLNVRSATTTARGTFTKRKPPAKDPGKDREVPAGLSLPTIVKVKEDEWNKQEPPFEKHTALKVKHAGEEASESADGADKESTYDFYVNIDNLYLKSEQKVSTERAEILEARFVYGNVLIGLSLLRDNNEEVRPGQRTSVYDAVGVEDLIGNVSRSLAPIVLPMIEYLGAIDAEEAWHEEETSELPTVVLATA